MAQLILAAAGAAVGSLSGAGIVAFGMTGAQIGWTVGGLLGGMLTPAQKVQGPRLSDLSVTGSSYGSVIPYFEGAVRVAGQIIWASEKRGTKTTTRQGGKGGGGQKVTTWSYAVDLMLLLSDCEIAPVALKVFSNGDLIYATQSGIETASLLASQTAPPWDRMTVYSGVVSQEPDPDYEAAVGVANALAFRGRGTVFIKGLQIGQSGNIPNLTFLIAREITTGVDTDGVVYEEVSQTHATFPVYDDNKATAQWYDTSIKKWGSSSLAIGRMVMDTKDASSNYAADTLTRMRYQYPGQQDVVIEGWVYLTNYSHQSLLFKLWNEDVSGVHADQSHIALFVDSNGKVYPKVYTSVPNFWYRAGVNVSFPDVVDSNYPTPTGLSFYGDAISGINHTTRNPEVVPLNTWAHVAVFRYDSQFYTRVNSVVHKHKFLDAFGAGGKHHNDSIAYTEGGYDYYEPSRTTMEKGEALFLAAMGTDPKVSLFVGSSFLNTTGARFDSVRVRLGRHLLEAEYSLPTAAFVRDSKTLALYNFNSGPTYQAVEPTIQAVVERLCGDRAGIPSGKTDATALGSIPTPVHSMLISQVSTVRSVLDILMGSYFFDVCLSNANYFRPRARASAATIPFEDLGWVEEGGSFSDRLPLELANELELPAQIFLTYSNIDADFQTDTQQSDRVFTSQINSSVIQLPLGFTASEAKKIADARLADLYVGLLTSRVRLNAKYADLESTDAIILVDEDGSRYRQRIVKKTDTDLVLIELETVGDDASVFSQLGLTVGGVPEQTVVTALPDTFLALLDAPLLRDADNQPGHYLAVKGSSDRWFSAEVYVSRDDVTYVLIESFVDEAVFGTAYAALGDWTGFSVFDELSTVIVNVGLGQLSSSTRTDILNSPEVNAAMIGSELVQFRTATLISSGVYRLTGFLRGRKGSDWAMTGHAPSERFVLLTTIGMRFIPMDIGDLNRDRYYKGVSGGQRLSAVTSDEFTPQGVNLIPLSPAQVRANRDTDDTVLTLLRRSRLTTRFGGDGTQGGLVGEVGLNMEIDVFSDSGFTTVVRTLILTETETIIYTLAQQTVDFPDSPPNQGELYLRAYQISSTVGRGYVRQATL